jgi:hypothetical protein
MKMVVETADPNVGQLVTEIGQMGHFVPIGKYLSEYSS